MDYRKSALEDSHHPPRFIRIGRNKPVAIGYSTYMGCLHINKRTINRNLSVLIIFHINKQFEQNDEKGFDSSNDCVINNAIVRTANRDKTL